RIARCPGKSIAEPSFCSKNGPPLGHLLAEPALRHARARRPRLRFLETRWTGETPAPTSLFSKPHARARRLRLPSLALTFLRPNHGRIPTAPIMRPVTPFSARKENKRSTRQEVHRGKAPIFFAETPAASNWRRFASTRSRKKRLGRSPWPGERALRKGSGYFSWIGYE